MICSFCNLSFQDAYEFKLHCQSETHQKIVISNEVRDWKYRTPPRGFTKDSYLLCENYSDFQSCYYGNQCIEAHGLDELIEWKERFQIRKTHMERALIFGKSYTDILLEKWNHSESPYKVMCEKIDKVEVICNNELVTSMISKLSKKEWVFTLKTKRPLIAVALLQNSHRNNFIIKSIDASGCSKLIDLSIANDNNVKEVPDKDKPSIQHLKNNQEWVATEKSLGPQTIDLEHKVEIQFHTEIFGTFRQSVAFDFGCLPVLVKHICVDIVVLGETESKETETDINTTTNSWNKMNANIIEFNMITDSHSKNAAYIEDQKMETSLFKHYPSPIADTFTLSESTTTDKRLTKTNYRCRFHELLYIEEMARRDLIASYNLTTRLYIVKNYMFTPNGRATNTVKYSNSGHLFGLMMLDKDISEDTSAGRLILSSCTTVYLSTPQQKDTNEKRDVYEALIEDKCKNSIYIKLSAECVQQLNLKPDTDYQLDIQFQLNRLSYCEWHKAIDNIPCFLIFPNTANVPSIPWSTTNLILNSDGAKLNVKQKEAISIITTSLKCFVPPILLTGPFGSGKTYTLAQAIKPLLTQSETRLLICTHSNSAADIYIKQYLHPWVEKGLTTAKPLRIYYHKRRAPTVHHIIRKYCIIDKFGNFQKPTVTDIMKYRIVVATLSTSTQLVSLGLHGYFTHIFLDEAAQALECETIIPLELATASTRIVLAGDHMQTNAELFSNFAKDCKLHISLIERFYHLYPSNFACKILLCEIYRAHEVIINFTSELFYEQKLIASGTQVRHNKFYPLTFFTARGEDVQDKNSVAFYNNSEVYEVVERVCELIDDWPTSWGKIKDSSIGIITPYSDQVFRIRAELRKRRKSEISVERVLNVQGKQFRAVFISTVRTRRTCVPLCGSIQTNVDYGFLSNSKLLNTAITRGQSLVAVVGDPVALCSISDCRKIWERFIDICNQNNSFHGMPRSFLRSQLDWVEFKKSFLNPLAAEFFPTSTRFEGYLNNQVNMMHQKNAPNMQLQQPNRHHLLQPKNGTLLQNQQLKHVRMKQILTSNINRFWTPVVQNYPVIPIEGNPQYGLNTMMQQNLQNGAQMMVSQNYSQPYSQTYPLPILNIPNMNPLLGGPPQTSSVSTNAASYASNINCNIKPHGLGAAEKIPPPYNPQYSLYLTPQQNLQNNSQMVLPLNYAQQNSNTHLLSVLDNSYMNPFWGGSCQGNHLSTNASINASNTIYNIRPNVAEQVGKPWPPYNPHYSLYNIMPQHNQKTEQNTSNAHSLSVLNTLNINPLKTGSFHSNQLDANVPINDRKISCNVRPNGIGQIEKLRSPPYNPQYALHIMPQQNHYCVQNASNGHSLSVSPNMTQMWTNLYPTNISSSSVPYYASTANCNIRANGAAEKIPPPYNPQYSLYVMSQQNLQDNSHITLPLNYAQQYSNTHPSSPSENSYLNPLWVDASQGNHWVTNIPTTANNINSDVGKNTVEQVEMVRPLYNPEYSLYMISQQNQNNEQNISNATHPLPALNIPDINSESSQSNQFDPNVQTNNCNMDYNVKPIDIEQSEQLQPSYGPQYLSEQNEQRSPETIPSQNNLQTNYYLDIPRIKRLWEESSQTNISSANEATNSSISRPNEADSADRILPSKNPQCLLNIMSQLNEQNRPEVVLSRNYAQQNSSTHSLSFWDGSSQNNQLDLNAQSNNNNIPCNNQPDDLMQAEKLQPPHYLSQQNQLRSPEMIPLQNYLEQISNTYLVDIQNIERLWTESCQNNVSDANETTTFTNTSYNIRVNEAELAEHIFSLNNPHCSLNMMSHQNDENKAEIMLPPNYSQNNSKTHILPALDNLYMNPLWNESSYSNQLDANVPTNVSNTNSNIRSHGTGHEEIVRPPYNPQNLSQQNQPRSPEMLQSQNSSQQIYCSDISNIKRLWEESSQTNISSGHETNFNNMNYNIRQNQAEPVDNTLLNNSLYVMPQENNQNSSDVLLPRNYPQQNPKTHFLPAFQKLHMKPLCNESSQSNQLDLDVNAASNVSNTNFYIRPNEMEQTKKKQLTKNSQHSLSWGESSPTNLLDANITTNACDSNSNTRPNVDQPPHNPHYSCYRKCQLNQRNNTTPPQQHSNAYLLQMHNRSSRFNILDTNSTTISNNSSNITPMETETVQPPNNPQHTE